jgi:hypothetical protein
MKRKEPIPATQKILLGIMGERIVAHTLRQQGHVVEESLNVFDTEKDMLVDNNPVEVKTQVPYMIEDSFAVFPNQLKKLKNCHRAYFVSVPLKAEDPLAGGIFEIDLKSEDVKAHRVQRHDGVSVICFPRRQKEMKMIYQITDEGILEQLKKLSTSYL